LRAAQFETRAGGANYGSGHDGSGKPEATDSFSARACARAFFCPFLSPGSRRGRVPMHPAPRPRGKSACGRASARWLRRRSRQLRSRYPIPCAGRARPHAALQTHCWRATGDSPSLSRTRMGVAHAAKSRRGGFNPSMQHYSQRVLHDGYETETAPQPSGARGVVESMEGWRNGARHCPGDGPFGRHGPWLARSQWWFPSERAATVGQDVVAPGTRRDIAGTQRW
jgi:hypothetical protein